MDDRLLVLIAIYLLPALVAFANRHNSRSAILALNLLAGWTLLGWFAALIWSLTGNTEKRDARIIATARVASRDLTARN